MDGSIDLTRGRKAVFRPAGSAVARWARRVATRLSLAFTAGLRLQEPISVALAATALLSLFFLAFPAVDMAVSRAFHDGGGFPLSADSALRALRKSASVVLGLILIAALTGLTTAVLRRGSATDAWTRKALFLLAGLAVGPGLVVNGLLKSWWGRPRPIQIEAFGGEAAYTPVWWISDACASNCSFVSGEASSSAWMVAALLLLPERARRIAAAPVIVYAMALSANRIAFGGHFLSDVLLAWSLAALVLAVLYRLMVASPGAARHRRIRSPARPTAVPA